MEPIAYRELDALEAVHWWYQGMRQITATFLQRMPNDGQSVILDAGCGTGGNLVALQRYGRVYGFDFSAMAVGYAAKRHRGLAQADIRQIPFPSNYFDLVTSFDVLVMVPDDLQALREVARVVKHGGYVLVRVAAMDAFRGPHDNIVHSIRRYTRGELRQKLEQAGLKPLHLTYANTLLAPAIYIARRWQSWRGSPQAETGSDVRATPEPFNTVLKSALNIEAWWINQNRGFPFGVSLFAFATKA